MFGIQNKQTNKSPLSVKAIMQHAKKKYVEWKHAFKSGNPYLRVYVSLLYKLQILQAHTLKEKHIVIILKLQWKH